MKIKLKTLLELHAEQEKSFNDEFDSILREHILQESPTLTESDVLSTIKSLNASLIDKYESSGAAMIKKFFSDLTVWIRSIFTNGSKKGEFTDLPNFKNIKAIAMSEEKSLKQSNDSETEGSTTETPVLQLLYSIKKEIQTNVDNSEKFIQDTFKNDIFFVKAIKGVFLGNKGTILQGNH